MLYLPPQVHTALRLLTEAGHQAFVVGGAVRDAILGNGPAKDWDVTTSARPAEVLALFRAHRCTCIETGLRHGTVTVLLDGLPLEITTYRVDGAYSDFRRPDTVRFTASLAEDLARRDFTMNALAYHPETGLVDHWNGVADLQARLVRCVGDPERRFREDALRILRALRFAAVYEMDIEPATAAAVHDCAPLLQKIAAERVRVELTRLLCGAGAERILTAYADVLAVVLPELTPLFGLDQHNPHHDRDVWTHTVAVVAHTPPDPVLRWTALLHDIGKPHCFSVGADGVGHFYGHAAESVRLADVLLHRLRFDNRTRTRILQLIRSHDTPLLPERKPLQRLLRRLGPEAARQLITLHIADTRGQAPQCQPRIAQYRQAADLLDTLIREAACFSLRDLAVDGRDMLALGLRGKEIGAALEYCLSAVIDGAVPNTRDALLTCVRTANCAEAPAQVTRPCDTDHSQEPPEKSEKKEAFPCPPEQNS